MQTYHSGWIFLLLVAFCIGGCSIDSAPEIELPTQTADVPTEIQPDQPAPAAESMPSEVQYEIIMLDNPQESGKTDVYRRDPQTGEQQLFVTVPDVYRMHYHNHEYHAGSLYIVRRIGLDEDAVDVDSDWTDELWKYDGVGDGVRLYAAKGIDFRVSPGEEYIAVATGDAVIGEKVVFVDSQGAVVQEFSSDRLAAGDEMLMPHLLTWSGDSAAFWVRLSGPGPSPWFVDRVTVSTWALAVYDVSHLTIGDDYDLNPDSGRLVFSDYPVFFMQDNADEFKESGTAVTLSVFDLQTQALTQIAVSKAQGFQPLWLGDSTIEYNDPVSGGRITQKLQ